MARTKAAAHNTAVIEGLVADTAKKVFEQEDVQTVAESDLARVAREESFMNERVKIVLHSSIDPNAPPYFRGGVAQDQETVFREIPTYVKRKTLEVIARMKETRVSQDMQRDGNGEILPQSTLRGHTGLVWPFIVVEDKNPKGGAWLSNILAERG